MSSLTRCLQKLGLSEHEAAVLRGIHAQNVADGLSAQEAAIQAVEQVLDILWEDHANVVAEITRRGGDVPAGTLTRENSSRPARPGSWPGRDG